MDNLSVVDVHQGFEYLPENQRPILLQLVLLYVLHSLDPVPESVLPAVLHCDIQDLEGKVRLVLFVLTRVAVFTVGFDCLLNMGLVPEHYAL